MKEDYVREAQVLRVVDGDTLELEVDLGFYVYHHIRVRLLDVDTPEIYGVKKTSEEYQRGKVASAQVNEWIDTFAKEGAVLVKTYKAGKYGRWLAHIMDITGNHSLNEYLYELGYGTEQV